MYSQKELYNERREEDNQKRIEELNQTAYPVVERWVLKNHGTVEDSKDVFHDALLMEKPVKLTT